MFAIRLRVRPWSARCSPRSVGRLTRIWSSSCATVMSLFTRSWSSPLGPFTRTSSGSMATSTPDGTAIGCLPIRLMSPCSPDPRHELAAHALAGGVVAGHHATGGGHDRRAHPALDTRDRAGGHVLAPPGLGDALEPADHGPAVLGVLEAHAQRPADAPGLDREVLDVALLAQDPCQLGLERGRRHLDVVVVGVQPVADPGQEVCDGVGLRHLPARLRESRDHALVGDLAQADAAEPELAQIRARAAAPLAAVVVACLVLRSALLADHL